MKVGQALTGLLAVSAATSKNQVEASLPLGKLVTASRGVCTGAICTEVNNIASAWNKTDEKTSTDDVKSPPMETTSKTSHRHPGDILKQTMKNLPKSFGVNAVATSCVDTLFGTPRKALGNIRQSALPLVTMGVTKEILRDSTIPQPAKDAIAYSAFWGTKVAIGKNPISAGLAVSGFAAGASLVKNVSVSATNSSSSLKKKLSEALVADKPVSTSAVSGFLSPESSKTPSKATSESYDDHIRKRYGMQEGEKFWEGPDGSIFVPLNDAKDKTQ